VVLDGITKPEIAEVMVCREGLALAADLMLTSVGWHRIVPMLPEAWKEEIWVRMAKL